MHSTQQFCFQRRCFETALRSAEAFSLYSEAVLMYGAGVLEREPRVGERAVRDGEAARFLHSSAVAAARFYMADRCVLESAFD